MRIKDLFNEPKIISVIGNVNEAKSNLLYHIIEELKKEGTFNLYTYGLKKEIKHAIKIYSVTELEQIKNSIIIIDEVMTLFDLDNRMAKRQIENTLRLIYHNNNILLICAVPENVKKFISGKINVHIFKKVTIADFINGSRTKQIVTNYKGQEVGSSVLNLDKNEAVIFDEKHYHKINIPYLKHFDSKVHNQKIIQKNVKIFVNKNVNKSVTQ